jgi:hypothetical protein
MDDRLLLLKAAPGKEDVKEHVSALQMIRKYKKLGLLSIVFLLALRHVQFNLSVVYESDPRMAPARTLADKMKNIAWKHAPKVAQSLFKPPAPTSLRFVSTVSLGGHLSFSIDAPCHHSHFETCKTMHKAAIELKVKTDGFLSWTSASVAASADTFDKVHDMTSHALSNIYCRIKELLKHMAKAAKDVFQKLATFLFIMAVFVQYGRWKLRNLVSFADPFDASTVKPLYGRQRALTTAEIRAGLLEWALVVDPLNPTGRRILRPVHELLLSLHRMLPVALEENQEQVPWDDGQSKILQGLCRLFDLAVSLASHKSGSSGSAYVGHAHFGKWKKITTEDLMLPSDVELDEPDLIRYFKLILDPEYANECRSCPDMFKVGPAIRRVKFLLHPDKLPRDLSSEERFLARMLWHIIADAQTEDENDGVPLEGYAWVDDNDCE